MRGSRTTIPEWELLKLRAITDGPTVQDREAALEAYLQERERRKRYARVRDARDRQRRTLVGAHMPLEEAERVTWLANLEGLSTTAYVRRALEAAGQQTMKEAETIAQDGDWGWAATTVSRP